MRSFLQFLLGLIAPFLLVFSGSGIAGIGLNYSIPLLSWVGGIIVIAGIIWGAFLVFFSGAGLWD